MIKYIKLKKESTYFIFSLITIALLSGCANVGDVLSTDSQKFKIDYLPYQTEKDGRWGLIGTDGKVLFEPEFKNNISYSVNGVFAEDKSTDYHNKKIALYKADKEHNQIGEDYLAAGYFLEDIAPVVAEGEPIKFIDKEGNVVFKLDKINGKRVTAVSNFSDGLCAYLTEDTLWGYIDKEGKSVIPAKYHYASPFAKGKAFVFKANEKKDEVSCSIIDKKGNVSKSKKYKSEDEEFRSEYGFLTNEEYIALGKHGRDRVIDRDGNVVIKGKSKYKEICPIGDEFVVETDNGAGIMNKDEKMIVRPKYRWVMPAFADNLYIAYDDDKSYLIGGDGKKIEDVEYDEINHFLDGKHAVVKDGNEYYFIDTKGKAIDNETYYRIYNIGGERWFKIMMSMYGFPFYSTWGGVIESNYKPEEPVIEEPVSESNMDSPDSESDMEIVDSIVLEDKQNGPVSNNLKPDTRKSDKRQASAVEVKRNLGI